MKVALFATFLLCATVAGAAAINTSCSATVQATGACSAANNGVAGVLFGYWVSLTDGAPADADINSDAIDLRDAICSNFGIATANCTSATADGAVRKYLEAMVVSYRKSKKVVAIPTVTVPTIDAQQNP